jgi:hypothetical protein
MHSHFWAVHYAFMPLLLVNQYMVWDALPPIPGAHQVYLKRADEL